MKKQLALIALAAAALLAASCIRKDDLDILHHPVHVQGEADPHLGVPVASGEVTLGDVLSMLSSTYTGYVNPDSNTITITYDANIHDSIKAGSYITTALALKDDVITLDTTIGYSVSINLFDDASIDEIAGDGNIDINHLWLSIDGSIKGNCPAEVAGPINDAVSIRLSDFTINYVDHGGTLNSYDQVENVNINFEHVLETNTLQHTFDLAPIVNAMPQRIDISMKLHMSVNETVYGYLFNDPVYFSKLMDSIKLTTLIYDLNAHVEFPFDIHIGYLPYTYDLDLGEEGLSGIDIDELLASTLGEGSYAELKDSELDLDFENGIPMNIELGAWLIDANGVPDPQPLIADTTIASAPTADAGDNTRVATGSTKTTVSWHIDSQLLERLQNTRYIRLLMALSTGDNAAGNHVKVQKTDYLKIRARIRVHPAVQVDIPVTDDGIL